MNRTWTPDMEQILRDLYPDHDSEDVAIIIGVTKGALNTKAHALGIKKSAAGLLAANRASWNNGGKKAGFKPGQQSWNKGKKGSTGIHENSRRTQFNAGHLPHNTRSDGEISIREDNDGRAYKFIRTSLARWTPLHVHVWEEANGKTPKGHVIRFIDGDTLNCDIDNLECISRTLNMLLNSRHRYTRPMAEAAEQLSNLKKTIKEMR